MKPLKAMFLVSLLIALALVFAQGQSGNTVMAAAPTNVNDQDCGTVYNTPGEHLVLTKDLACPGLFAVVITANDVNFDLRGFTITGGSFVSIFVGGLDCTPTSGVHIHGGTVKESTT